MKVKELIEKLQKCNQELDVIIQGHYFEIAERVSECNLSHEKCFSYETPRVVLLGNYNSYSDVFIEKTNLEPVV